MIPKFMVGEVVVFNSGSPTMTVLGSKWNRYTNLFDYELIYFKTKQQQPLVKSYWNYEPDGNMVKIPEPAITKVKNSKL